MLRRTKYEQTMEDISKLRIPYCQIVIITRNVKDNRLYMCMCVYAFNRLFIMPSLRSFIHSFIHLSIHLFVLWFVYCIIYLFIQLFIHSEGVFVAWRSELCRFPLCMDIKTSLFCYWYRLKPTPIYENRVCEHFVISLNFPCLSLITVLFAYVFICCCCFVVRDLCRSGCRQNFANFFLPPPPPTSPLFGYFFPVPTHNTLSNTSAWFVKAKSKKSETVNFRL